MVTAEELRENIEINEYVKHGIENISQMLGYPFDNVFSVYEYHYFNAKTQLEDGVEKENSVFDAFFVYAKTEKERMDEENASKKFSVDAEKHNLATDLVDTEQSKLHRICLSGLPNYNFSRLFMAHMGMKNVHPEINYQNAISGLSAITLGRVRSKTKNMYGDLFKRPLKANIFSVVVAGSGDGKSVSHDEMFDIVSPVMGLDIFIEKKITPETLSKNIASEQINRKLVKEDVLDEEGEETGEKVEVLAEFNVVMPKKEIPAGWKVYWHSEFGGTLSNMAKPFMAGMKEDFCEYYSGSEGQKANSGEKPGETTTFVIKDTCISINGATTTEGIKKLTTDDQASGFELRFDEMYAPFQVELPDRQVIAHNNIAPENIIETLKEQRKTSGIEQDKITKLAMIKSAQIIHTLLRGQVIEAQFMEESYRLIINHEIIMRQHFADDVNKTLIRSRHMENIYKHCMLLAVGNLPFYVLNCKNFEGDKIDIHGTFEDSQDLPELFNQLANFDLSKIKNLRLSVLPIMPEIVKFVLKMYDRIYFPGKLAISEIISETTNSKSDVVKVRYALEDSPKIARDEVVASLKAIEAKVEKLCNALLEAKNAENSFAKPSLNKEMTALYESKYMEIMRQIFRTKENSITDKLVEEYILEDICNKIRMLSEMSENVIITHMGNRDLTRKTGIDDMRISPVVSTLAGINNIVPLYRSKNSVLYAYFPTAKNSQLPECEDNYTDYKYTGTYPNQIELNALSLHQSQ